MKKGLKKRRKWTRRKTHYGVMNNMVISFKQYEVIAACPNVKRAIELAEQLSIR